MDGMYFLLLFGPFVLSIWLGDLLRKKTISYLLNDRSLNNSLSAFAGFSVQTLIIIFGALTGYFLVKIA
jgi:hypothetical protein